MNFSVWFWSLCLCVSVVQGEVVINEVFYNAPDDLDLEFVELHAATEKSVELSGWTLADAKDTLFAFPKGSRIEAGGYLVLSRGMADFETFYGFEAAGELTRGLGNGGDEVILKDESGMIRDQLAYDDEAPWPVVADGMSASLERVHPLAPGALASSWVPSPSSNRYQTQPGGSPGKVNVGRTPGVPPRVKAVIARNEVKPGHKISVRVELEADSPPVKRVRMAYRFVTGNELGPVKTLSAKADSSGRFFSATLPTRKERGILRYWILAEGGKKGLIRRVPAAHALRPAFSVVVTDPVPCQEIPVVQFLLPEENFPKNLSPFFYRRNEAVPDRSAQGKAAFILTEPKTGISKVFDFVHITQRKGGYKVRLHKDRLWREMSTINVLGVFGWRHTLCEPLAFELHRRAGVPASWADFFQVEIDGERRGVHLAFEQPNKAFLRRNDLDDDGNLFKAIWQASHRPSQRAYPSGVDYPQRLIGRHEKKTNVHEDYGDLVELVEELEKGEALPDPEGIINYFAANSLLSHWDGFHNNYFLYHEVSKKTDKWWLFPWDQDKTWGFHDRVGPNEVFFSLPLNAGRKGFLPPDQFGPDDRFQGAIGLRGAAWYRYGGEISRAVLDHPETGKRFLLRIRELAMEVFTEEIFGPEMDQMEKRLQPEVTKEQAKEIRQTLALYR
ncbi:MAG: CotH kinase family protein, partial [Verrucomicrobiota bacterium]